MTARGIRLAIENLPVLEHLNCVKSLQVVARMFQEGFGLLGQQDSSKQQSDGTARRLLPLTDLHCQTDRFFPFQPEIPYSAGDLAAAIQLCPYVVQVELEALGRDFSDQDLLTLRNLTNLRHFQLQATSNRISFKGGVLPILQKFGPKSLEFLALSCLNDVYLDSIVQLCPKLQSFFTFAIDFSPQRQVKPDQYLLHHLEHMGVQVGRNNTPTSDHLSLLLSSSPSLVTLKLIGLNGLNDRVMETAALSHGFAHLKILEVGNCPNLTYSSIDHLLTLTGSPLNVIHVSNDSDQFSQERIKAWRKLAENNNWDLSITESQSIFGF